jgi:hypothetical protein
MNFTISQIAELAARHFELKVSAEQLPGEIDLNFLVKTRRWRKVQPENCPPRHQPRLPRISERPHGPADQRWLGAGDSTGRSFCAGRRNHGHRPCRRQPADDAAAHLGGGPLLCRGEPAGAGCSPTSSPR